MTSTEANYSFTTKLNGDLLTVRGDSADEFFNNIEYLDSDILAAIGRLQEAVRAVGVVAAAVSDHSAFPAHDAPHPGSQPPAEHECPSRAPTHFDAAPAAPAGALETLADRWGNQWTYGLPDAPDLPDGRGKYALKAGTSKAGKPYKAFFDPAKGPKPFPKGQFEAEPIWPKR